MIVNVMIGTRGFGGGKLASQRTVWPSASTHCGIGSVMTTG
jgi:hypothetical protein